MKHQTLPFITDKPVVFFDIESTGTDVATDRIITLSAIKIPPTGFIEPREWMVFPGMPIPIRSTEIHGITDDMVNGKPLFREVAADVFTFFLNSDLGGFNARGFDIPLLWEEFNRCSITWNLEGVRIFDGNEIFRRKETRTLADAVRKYCGREHEEAHDATADAEASMDVVAGQLRAYEDLCNMTADELHTFCTTDEFEGQKATRVDLAGHIIRTEDGVSRYTAKRVRGVPVVNDPGYGWWMVKNDFPVNTKLAIRRILEADRDDLWK